MRAVREQMLCIVTPLSIDAPVQAITAASQDLDDLFTEIGFVHFASLALLPPSRGSSIPRLLLELAVDEGDRPDVVLDRLAHEPVAALYQLYGHDVPGSGFTGERADRLRDHLIRHLSIAAGAFVGPRDRYLRQVRDEDELYRDVRRLSRHVDPSRRGDRGSYASALARLVSSVPKFAWVNDPAPRSFWRAHGNAFKVGFGLLVVAVLYLALRLLRAGVDGLRALRAKPPAWLSEPLQSVRAVADGVCSCPAAVSRTVAEWLDLPLEPGGELRSAGESLSRLVAGGRQVVETTADGIPVLKSIGQALADSWRRPFDWELGVASAALHAITDMVDRTGTLLLVAGLLLLGYRTIAGLLGPFAARWRAWFRAFERELNRPTDARSSRIVHLTGWLTAGVIVVLLALTVAYILAGERWLDPLADGYLSSDGELARRAVQVYAAVYAALLLVLVVALRSARASLARPGDPPLVRAVKAFRRWFFEPFDTPVPRAQQVHPTIEACEAWQVGGAAHMVSLVDLRRPYAWSAWWTRVSLWFVTTLGYVYYTEGTLNDAPGIQFSHWHVIDRGRQLLFCANFDGTFGGYLDDFIKGPATGTTLFWRWTELRPRLAATPSHPEVTAPRRFPPTRLVIYRGVRCESWFKTYARESMLPHLYRYSAVNLTLEQKNRRTVLRDALSGERTDAKDDVIMRSLET